MSNTLRKLKLKRKIILKTMELQELKASYKELKSSTEAKIAIKGLGMELHSDTDFYPTDSECSDDAKTINESEKQTLDYLRAQPERCVKDCLPELWKELTDCDMPKKTQRLYYQLGLDNIGDTTATPGVGRKVFNVILDGIEGARRRKYVSRRNRRRNKAKLRRLNDLIDGEVDMPANARVGK